MYIKLLLCDYLVRNNFDLIRKIYYLVINIILYYCSANFLS